MHILALCLPRRLTWCLFSPVYRKQACLRDDMGLQSQHLEVTDKKDFRPSPPLSVGGCLPHFHELSAPQYDPAAIAHEQQTPATSVFGDVPDTLSEVSRPSVSD
ncbi:hypothetical protein LEMLEM_LOCUS20664 [Lemmus lemmus]